MLSNTNVKIETITDKILKNKLFGPTLIGCSKLRERERERERCKTSVESPDRIIGRTTRLLLIVNASLARFKHGL